MYSLNFVVLLFTLLHAVCAAPIQHVFLAPTPLSEPSSAVIASPSPTAPSVHLESVTMANSSSSSTESATFSGDLFQPVATSAPLSMFTRTDHPLQPVGVSADTIENSTIPTSSFYTNMLLGSQTNGAYALPYLVWLSNATTGGYGLAVSYTNHSQRVFGPNTSVDPVEYFLSPTGILEFAFSSTELAAGPAMNLTDLKKYSVNATLSPPSGSGSLSVPLTIGSAFVTATYNGLTPVFRSAVGFQALTKGTSPRSGVQKYTLTLENGRTWVLYATVPDSETFSLSLTNGTTISNSASVDGVTVQVAYLPDGQDDTYDDHAGAYPTAMTVSGTAAGATATWNMTWTYAGACNAGKLLLFALPHHLPSFTSATNSTALEFSIDTRVKGTLAAYSTNSFELSETLPYELGFAPWSAISGASANYTTEALGLISEAAISEGTSDITNATDLDSYYYSGKILDKYAQICWVAHSVLQNSAITKICLANLKAAFSTFSENRGQYELMYDQTYKGIISNATMATGDSLADFGNTYYNDHHFHFGYFIHAAAVIGAIDSDLGGSWADDNKDYVNALIRDVANPSEDDSYFSVSRHFDWYNGHSWAKGLYESADGKDEESTSEDYHHLYGIRLWGKVVGDSSMEARGLLSLAVMRRALQTYFLYLDDNTVMPSQIIGNKVSGILFENKVDHTTYFGTNLEYIQGIHMIPLSPVSSYMRTPEFVEQEWKEKLASLAPTLTDGWKGILYGNLALYDPQSAYDFFATSSFNTSYLDNGASQTYYLAYCAGVGGTTS
ncbi:endo-1,3(4)-beta-glucanase [Dipodascopsis tothii]|uniref:endo-1,3(4)-beta-glucanase n=1 Tax=Dipodascopsis tothii TaxID=44089 RepID=UPI0034CFE8DD